ncbi:MAG: trimethylamine methyltransferase family protein [Candidatus Methanomethylicia archaeon]
MRTGFEGGQIKILNKDQVLSIHNAILKIMSEIGVQIQHENALKILYDAGATVDFKKQVVKFPESLVMESIKKTPKSIRFCGRNSEEDFIVDSRKVFFGPCSGAPSIIDFETGERRAGRLSDMANVAKLCDALKNIDFVMGLTSASDIPPALIPLYEPYIVLSNTCKHVQVFCYGDGELTKTIIKIAELISGGIEELRRRPIVSLYDEPQSPLFVGREYVESLIEWCSVGLPIIYAPIPISGANAPVTLAGNIAQGCAESLAGLVLAQLINPGTPFVFGTVPLILNMRYGVVSYETAETLLMQVILAQIADFYQLPSWGTGGMSDSKILDEQAIAEASMSLVISSLSGHSLIHDLGFLESAKSGSLELIVICDELISILKRFMRGVRVDDETLAVDTIKAVSYGGSFLSLKHTIRNLPLEYVMSEIMDKSSWTTWSKHRRTLLQNVKRKMEKILREHYVEPIPNDIKASIENLIKNYLKSKT